MYQRLYLALFISAQLAAGVSSVRADAANPGIKDIVPRRMMPCMNADIYIVADWSGSVQKFQETLVRAVARFAYGIEPEVNKVSIALLTFGSQTAIEFPLTSDISEIHEGLRNLLGRTPNADSTLIAGALEWVTTSVMNRDRTYRQERAKIVILISDGQIFDAGYLFSPRPYFGPLMLGSEDALVWASLLREEGGTLYAINVGNPSDQGAVHVLKQLSASKYMETNYEDLAQMLLKLNLCS